MNSKGFTLIELLATVTLLGIIAIISFVSINAIVNNGKITNCKNLVNNIKSAANEYVSDNRYGNVIDTDDDKVERIDVKLLIDKHYLSGPIVDPFDNNKEILGSDISIIINLNDNYTVKDLNVFNKNNEKINCERGFL